MGKWIQKFSSTTEYNLAEHDYPNVSLIDGDGLVYASETPSVNDKVMMYFNSGADSGSAVLFNGEASDINITAMWLNDEPITVESQYQGINSGEDYIVKYDINGTVMSDEFSGDLGMAGASDLNTIEFLIPAKVTEVSSLPSNHMNYLVFMGDTPPSVTIDMSSLDADYAYCPDDVVSTYQSSAWGLNLTFVGLSDYDGNLRYWFTPDE